MHNRLRKFLLNYGNSGKSVMHIATLMGVDKNSDIDILQMLFDQFHGRDDYSPFKGKDLKEFYFLSEYFEMEKGEAYLG